MNPTHMFVNLPVDVIRIAFHSERAIEQNLYNPYSVLLGTHTCAFDMHDTDAGLSSVCTTDAGGLLWKAGGRG
jgi:hypothetical protein